MTDCQILHMKDTYDDDVTVDATDTGKVSVIFGGAHGADMLFTRKQARRLARALKTAAAVAPYIAE
jgi:uncharacterized membrane protein YebE (DUF533 family)